MTPMTFDIAQNIARFKASIPENVTLLAVSKTKPVSMLQEAYEAGQRDFGENKVQELRDKHPALAQDIRWHMIGHLQTNKVKYIAPFIYMIHAVDSLKLLKEIDKRAAASKRIIKVLLQVHIAQEEAKFGFDEKEILDLFKNEHLESYANIAISGLMGMATNTTNKELIRKEFNGIHSLFTKIRSDYPNFTSFKELSIGMSNDYKIAIEEGSTMIRIGSSLFGAR
jgi:pyridoxal phosphate enzyme (YggS family)